MRELSQKDVDRLARLALAGWRRTWADTFKALSPEIAESLIAEQVLLMALGWHEPENIAVSELNKVTRRAYEIVRQELAAKREAARG